MIYWTPRAESKISVKMTNFICAMTAAEVPSHIFFNAVDASEYFQLKNFPHLEAKCEKYFHSIYKQAGSSARFPRVLHSVPSIIIINNIKTAAFKGKLALSSCLVNRG